MQIADARKKSDVVEGSADNGWFIPPTLVVNPPSEAKILQEETFGPVMTIHPFKSDDEAIELANKTGYGLSASIFGKKKKQIKYNGPSKDIKMKDLSNILKMRIFESDFF